MLGLNFSLNFGNDLDLHICVLSVKSNASYSTAIDSDFWFVGPTENHGMLGKPEMFEHVLASHANRARVHSRAAAKNSTRKERMGAKGCSDLA